MTNASSGRAAVWLRMFTPMRCVLLGLLLAVCTLVLSSQQLFSSSRVAQYLQHETVKGTVAKVSMVYGETNELYERSLKSHERHAALQGYPVHILRNEVTSGYWNKPFHILSLLVQELGKNPDERVKWMMWFDADTVLINPRLPLEIFLPPDDFAHIHFLCAKDPNGLNTGVFFVRVHEWSLKMFAQAIGLPLLKPEVDLGWSPDQEAMKLTLQLDAFRQNVTYQPRTWYNTYQYHAGYEGQPGDLLVHFPGLQDDRWKAMSDWLDIVEGGSTKWEQELAHTSYSAQIEKFWEQIRDCKSTLSKAETYMTEETVDAYFVPKVERLRKVLENDMDQMEEMRWAAESVTRAMLGYA